MKFDARMHHLSFLLLLRVLYLYALVDTGGHGPTPLHMRPVRWVVAAPTAEWAWGREPVRGSNGSDASPEQGMDSVGAHWRYNEAESKAIWCGAGPYRGEPSE